MPGTLLIDDWRDAVEDQLRNTAQAAQRQLQVIADVPRQVAAQVPPPPDPNQVFQSLQQTAQNTLGGLQVIGAGAQQNAQDVSSQLQQTAQNTFSGLIPLQPPQAPIVMPQPEPPQSPYISAPTAPTAGGTFQDYARQKAQQYGVDPEIFVRQIQQESGFQPFNPDGTPKRSPAGATGIAQIVPSAHPAVDATDPYASLDYAARLMSNHLRAFNGDYSKALAAYNAGPGAVQQYGGVPPFEETQRYVKTILGGDSTAHAPSTPQQTPGTQIANTPNADGQVFPLAVKPSNRPDATYHSEGGSDLMAPRGTPVLNMRGGTVTSVYTDNGSHQAGGNAVLIHGDDGLDYYYAHFDQPPGLKPGQRVDTGAQIGAVGNSGNAWKDGKGETHLHIGIGHGISSGVGSEGGLGQNFNAQKLLGDLLSGVGQATTTTAGGAPPTGGPARPGVITIGDQTTPAARPPLYVGGQDIQALNARPGIQVLGDAADVARQRAEEWNRPPLQGVPEAVGATVGGAFGGLGTAAQGAIQAAEPARRWLTGEAQEEARARGYAPEFQARAAELARQQRAAPPIEITPGQVAGGVWNMLIQNPAAAGIQLDDYLRDQDTKNKWIEANNPARDVPLVGGLTSMIAQQLTDPLVVLSFTPTGALGRAVGASVTGRVAERVAEQLSPRAARWVADVAGRFTSGAITNGLQNALFEAEQPDSDPFRVGMALLVGAGLGGTLDTATPGVTSVIRRLGREVIDRVPDIRPQLLELALSRQRGEADVSAALGGIPDVVAAAARRVRGEAPEAPRAPGAPGPPLPPEAPAPPRPPTLAEPAPPAAPEALPRGVGRPFNYQPNTPEFNFNEAARASAATSPDGLAHVDLNQLPKDVLPFDLQGQGTRRIQLQPGGMPTLDNLRNLAQTSLRQRDFYADQADDAARLVGPNNVDEWLAVNSMTSAQTPLRDQVAEAIQTMGTVREVAARAVAQGKDVATEIVNALRSKVELPLMSYTHPQKRDFMVQGYTTGVAPVKGAPKTASFAGNYDSALRRVYDPRITNDTWDWQIMNVSDDLSPTYGAERIAAERATFEASGRRQAALAKAEAMPATTAKQIERRDAAIARAQEMGPSIPMQRRHFNNAANDDTAYRGVEAVFNELAAERGMDGHQMQSLLWSGIRHLFSDPELERMWKAGQFDEAIRLGEQRGVFQQKLGGEIDAVMDDPKVQAALQRWGHLLQEPAPLRGQGMQRTYAGEAPTKPAARPARPSSAAFREQERAFAEAGAPMVRGLDTAVVDQVGLDRERGIFPWLTASHRVVEVRPGEYAVHLPAGNVDTARYVAATVGQASDREAIPIHVPDNRLDDVIGIGLRGTEAEVDALQSALDNMGIPSVRGTTGRSLQVPFAAANDQVTHDAVIDAALSIGIPEDHLGLYSGATADVPRSDFQATIDELSESFAPTTPERRGLLERGLGRPPPPEGPAPGFTAPGGAEPPGGRLRRARGEAQLPFGINLGGAALGGYAGYAATPADSDWSEYARNIGYGATAGLLGTAAITRAGGPRLAEALAGRERVPPPPVVPERGVPLLEARTTGPGGVPRRIGEVHSNPHLLREAQPGETPLSDDELVQHYDDLEQRLSEVRDRAEAVDALLRSPSGAKVDRPPWAAGWTNAQLQVLAQRNGESAYSPGWYERLGFTAENVGEMREDVGQSGIRSIQGTREPSPSELRAERNNLAQEEKDLLLAADQLGSAPAGARFAKRPEGGVERGDLPFDVGSEEAAPHGPYAVEGNGPSGVLADDIVTKNGTVERPSGLSTLWSEPGQVVARQEGLTARGIADAEAAGIGPPTEATLRAMPNLEALLKEEVPDEVRAQIQKAVEDNPDLFAAYNQGRISHDSLRDDLARRVGMSAKDWLATPVGKGFSTPELVALQAAAVDAEHAATDMAREIMDLGGVDQLTPEQVAFGLSNLFDTTRLLAVARGARSTQGRSLNALKIRMDRQLSRGIAGANEAKAARRTAQQARRAATKATQLLHKTRDLDQEAAQAVTNAREAGVPKNILDQIADAYDQLDRYQAMSLHEKADDFARLKAERDARAAERKAKVREAPEELLSALRAELAAERKNFAGRKDTWETMAFWDSKAAEQAAEKRRAFRGGLYLEQQRKAANNAANAAEREAERAWEAASRRQARETERARTLLADIGGEAPTRELLDAFVKAVASDDPMVAAKFMKGLHPQRSGFANVVEAMRNSNIMRLAGMLSATATHVVNIGGNALKAGLAIPEHALTAAIDIGVTRVTGGERQAYFAELGPMAKGWFLAGDFARRNGPLWFLDGEDGRRLGALTSLKPLIRTLMTGITPAEMADLSKIRPGFRSSDLPIIGFPLGKLPFRAAERVIDPAIEMPLRLLQGEDMLFRGGGMGMHAESVAIREATREGYRGAARTARANNIVANLEDWPELYQEAAERAAYMIFQERRTVPGVSGVRLGGTAGELGEVGVSQVVPFRKTPINILAQGLGYSPLGALGVAEAVMERPAIRARIAAGEVPASRLGKQRLLAEQRAARATIGSAILGGMYLLGTQRDDQGKPKGTLTAMYDEDEASTYPQGWRAWSFRTENPANGEIVYTPFQNFGMAGVPMAMAAILADSERRGKKVWSDEKEIARAAAGIGRYALDTPFLQGLSDAVDLLHDPGKAGTKFIEGLAASYGPYSGAGRQIQRAFGVASRNPREGWNMLLDALEADYPGLSGNVPEATTPLGEPRTPGATGFGALVGRYDIERDEPTLAALRSAGVDIPRETKVLAVGRGYGVELTETERDQLKRARGAAIIAAVERERAKPRVAEWERTMQTASPDSAAYRDALQRYNGALRATVSGAASSANAQFQRQLGRDEVQRRMKLTREIEPANLGTSSLPVGELEAVR